MIIKTSDSNSVKPFVNKLVLPKSNSHKGQNGRVLIIGGSSLFHAASIWAAEVASHFVDIVHYCSTYENEKIFINLKTKFRNGIIIRRENLLEYIEEDDAILIGSGMIRGQISQKLKVKSQKLTEILKIENEADYAYCLTKFLIENFPHKRFVFDAGALQMMEKEWLTILKQPAIITPHQKEFENLFNESIHHKSIEEKVKIVEATAKKYKTVILLKAVVDIISDGRKTYVIEGGNAGLTKGGTGDVLAGLTTAFYAKNNPLLSSILSSYLLKRAAEELFKSNGYWYNIDNIIKFLPQILKNIVFDL